MYVKDEDGLGLALLFVQQAVLSAHEDNSPLKSVKTGKHSL
jgi:hypothetical protein